jgi:hypothetical protein
MSSYDQFSIDNLAVDSNCDFSKIFLEHFGNEDEQSDNPYSENTFTCTYYDETEFKKHHVPNSCLSILTLNIQSINSKFQEFSSFINSLQSSNCAPDIKCLQELWKLPCPDSLNINGYHPLIYKSRHNNSQGGGVGMYINVNISFEILEAQSIFVDRVFESIFVKIPVSKTKHVVIGSLYRPGSLPNSSPLTQYNQFSEIYANIVNSFTDLNLDFYICGDINIDLIKLKTCKIASEYIDLLFSLGLIQIVTKPTRCTPSSATLIDHIVTNVLSPLYESSIIVDFTSDHFPIFFSINHSSKPMISKTTESRDFSNENVTKFKLALDSFSWISTLESSDTQTAYNHFSDTLFSIFDLYFPIKIRKFNRNFNAIEKWMTRGLLISRSKKIQLGKLCAKSPSPINVENFKKYRNVYNSTIRAGKKLYYEKALKDNQSNLKKSWQLLKKAANISNKTSDPPSCFIIDGHRVSDHKEMADKLNIFFANIPTDIVSNILPTDELFVEDSPPDGPTLDFSDSPVLDQEIYDALAQLASKNSTDFNNLSMLFVKRIIQNIFIPLKHVISLSLSSGSVPSQLKIAKIVPIFKSGEKTNMDNYRPISLHSCFSKILEKVVANRLTSFLNLNNLITENQFGFRKNHSTVHPMMKFTNFISSALDKKEHAIALFCDLRKAFDTVDHAILLKKLKKLGIRGSAHLWFADYLTNRKQFVIINGKCSSLLNIFLGIPQGSILGPLLFLIYFNDLPQCSLLMLLLFADDATIYASGKDINVLVSFVNAEFHKITTYFRSHKMALHPSKTKFILFTNSTIIENLDVKILLNNNNANENLQEKISHIERIYVNSDVPAMKFLGVFFDPKLNFKYHIKQLSSKLSRALYILRTVKNILSKQALKTIYFSIFHCHLIYAIQIWSCTFPGPLTEIFLKQKQAIRLISGAKFNAHTEPLFKNLAILPLNDLCIYFKLQFVQQFKNGYLPQLLHDTWILNSARHQHPDEGNHGYEMRNFDDFFIPFSRLTTSDRLPLISFSKLWNNFSNNEIKLVANKKEFNNKLKIHLLSTLNATIVCARLTCQACHPFNI